MKNSALEKYCRSYAEREIAQLSRFPTDRLFHQVLVLPAYRESPLFLDGLRTLAIANSATLVVLIINQPAGDPPLAANRDLARAAEESGCVVWRHGQLALVDWPNHSALLCVDRYSEGNQIPARQGVGLARKVGCDLALALFQRAQLSARFIHNSDADARLPLDYFQQTQGLETASAAVYPFRHVGEGAVGTASALYEQALEHYVRGLRWAASPYAFHTIGSCLAVSLQHYALVRGFPRRAGGEDFYLLNKLAKLAPVRQTQGNPIQIQARRSDRVPFGTGPAVEKILAAPGGYRTYHPQVFAELANLLAAFRHLGSSGAEQQAWLAGLPAPARLACEALGITELFGHLQNQAKSASQLADYVRQWFDAFRTLKFIHHLQEHHYPALPLREALARAPWNGGDISEPGLSNSRKLQA